MKKIFKLSALMLTALATFSSCNNEWEDEQYEQYISIKSSPTLVGRVYPPMAVSCLWATTARTPFTSE